MSYFSLSQNGSQATKTPPCDGNFYNTIVSLTSHLSHTKPFYLRVFPNWQHNFLQLIIKDKLYEGSNRSNNNTVGNINKAWTCRKGG